MNLLSVSMGRCLARSIAPAITLAMLLPQSGLAQLITDDPVQPFACNGGLTNVVIYADRLGIGGSRNWVQVDNLANSPGSSGYQVPAFKQPGALNVFLFYWDTFEGDTSPKEVIDNTVVRFCFRVNSRPATFFEDVPLRKFRTNANPSPRPERYSAIFNRDFDNQLVKDGKAKLTSVKVIVGSAATEIFVKLGMIRVISLDAPQKLPGTIIPSSSDCRSLQCNYSQSASLKALLKLRVQQAREEIRNRN